MGEGGQVQPYLGRGGTAVGRRARGGHLPGHAVGHESVPAEGQHVVAQKRLGRGQVIVTEGHASSLVVQNSVNLRIAAIWNYKQNCIN